ncbi:MAG: ComF family protein [Thermodesulfobacteriota bacterium]
MLNFIFPSICISCKQPVTTQGICNDCQSGIKFLNKNQSCFICGVPFAFMNLGKDVEHLCARCLKGEFYFAKARGVAYFDGLLRDLLHGFKYRRKLHIGKILSDIFTANIPSDLNSFNLIVPVPIYLKKLREREFNQTAILSKNISETVKCEYDPFTLYKIKETPPQITFEKLHERKRNVRNFFSVRDAKKIKRRSILLVDDVYTTGSTVNECSRVLLNAGAASVQVLTLMRANK